MLLALAAGRGELTDRCERGRIAIEIPGGEEVQHALAILRFADDRELLDELPQRAVERVALEIEQFHVFFCHQLVKVIPGTIIFAHVVIARGTAAAAGEFPSSRRGNGHLPWQMRGRDTYG